MKKLSLIPLFALSIFLVSCNKESNIINLETNNQEFIDNNNYIPTTTEEIAYYKDINFQLRGLKLKSSLNKLLTKTHKHLSYTPNIWNACKITDQDPTNPNNVLLIYGWPDKDAKQPMHKRSISNDARNTTGENNSAIRQNLWEREHVFAKSLAIPKLVTTNTDDFFTEAGLIAGTDAHNLRPINGEWNNIRSNNKFANGKGNSGKIGSYYWYPGDEWKGDVARMIMYMFVRYGEQCLPNNIAIGGEVYINKNERDGMIDLFLKWNEEDPVSPIEKKRNDYHGNTNNQYAQGNRNPFIDNPYLANLIWGNDGNKIKDAENKWTKK